MFLWLHEQQQTANSDSFWLGVGNMKKIKYPNIFGQHISIFIFRHIVGLTFGSFKTNMYTIKWLIDNNQ